MNIGKETQEKKKNIHYGAWIIITILLGATLFLKISSPTGMITKELSYQKEIDQTFTESTTYALAFADSPRLIKISGNLNKQEGGYVKIWLDANNEKKLILDSSLLGESNEITFLDVCEESCSLNKMPVYAQLLIETKDATITLTKLKYQLSKDKNNAPTYTGPSEFNIKSGEQFTFSFPPYWEDKDNDELTYLATSPEDITMEVTQDGFTIFTTEKTQKLIPLTLIASDGIDAVRKNILLRIDKAFETTKVFKTTVDLSLNGAENDNIKKTEIEKGVFDVEIEEIGIISGELNTITLEGLRATETSIDTQIDYVTDERIGSAIFAVENIDVEQTIITVEKTREIDNPGVLRCENYDLTTGFCPLWEQTGIPLVDNGNTYTFTVNHFTAYAVGAASNLTIYDSSDSEAGSNPLPVGINVTFFANFTNASGLSANSTNGACNISFNHTGTFNNAKTMTFNATTQLHQFTRSFNISGGFAFNTSCYANGEVLSAVDGFNVSLICGSKLNLNTNITQSLNRTAGYNYCLGINQNNLIIDCQSNTLEGNHSTNSVGIEHTASLNNITIQHCTIKEWVDGIGTVTVNAFSASNSTFLNNTARNLNGIGIHITGNNNNITQNAINNVSNQGIILITGSSYNTVERSTIQNTSTGLFIGSGSNSQNNTIKNNTFLDNSIGIDLPGTPGAANTTIFHNIFRRSKSMHARDNNGGNYWNGTVGTIGQGNFWDDVITLDIQDANANGWGDRGTEYPYNRTNNGNVTGSVHDQAPQTLLCGDSITTHNIIGTIPTNLSQSTDRACITITAQNVSLDCNSFLISDNGTGIGIHAANTTNVTVQHCVIQSFTTGIRVENVTQFTALNDTLRNHTSSGIFLTNSNTDSVITQSTIEDNQGNGIHLYNELRDTISHNIIRNNSNGTFISVSQNITLLNNSISNNSRAAILNNGSARTNITDNIIIMNGRSTSPPQQISFENGQDNVIINHNTITQSQNESGIGSSIAEPKQGSGWTIRNNTITSNALGGIVIDIENSTINQNIILHNGRITISTGLSIIGDNNIIRHNIITNTTQDGVLLRESNITFENNSISNSTRHGLTLEGDNNTILNNTFFNNTEHGITMNNLGNNVPPLRTNRIINNTLRDNNEGLVLGVNTSGSIIQNNTFINNTEAQINITSSSTQNNTITSNIITGIATSRGLQVSAGYGNLFALNTLTGSTILADDRTPLGNNNYNDSVTGNSGGGNNWGNITLVEIIDTDADHYGDSGTQLPFNATSSAGLSNYVTGNVSDNRPVTDRIRATVGLISGGGGGNPKTPTIPTKPPVVVPLQRPFFPPLPPPPPRVETPKSSTPDQDIACMQLNGTLLHHLISQQITLPEGVTIPEGYTIIKGPFQLTCQAEYLDVTFTLPDNYDNLKMLRCFGIYCSEITKKETDFVNLQCGNRTIHKIISERLEKREDILFTPDQDLILEEEQTQESTEINEKQRIITHGRTKMELTGWIPPFFKITIEIPQHTITQPANPSLRIVGIPKIITIEKNREGMIPARILFPYAQQEGIEEGSIRLFYYKENQWNLLESNVNEKEGVLEVFISDLNTHAENNQILLATLGVKCALCKPSFLEKQTYDYEATKLKQVYQYENGRDAYIFIHGLMSSPSTFEYVVADFQYSKQPGQIWVLEYSTGKDINRVAEEFIDEIEGHLDQYDRLHFIGYSLGSFVIQRGLEKAQKEQKKDSLRYRFLDKIQKVVLIASPNEGTPGVEVYENFFKYTTNEKTGIPLFNINSAVLKQLSEGIFAERLSNIPYYVMAGSESYTFNLGLFNVESAKMLGLHEKNDGITTVLSAQKVGGAYINNSCEDFFEINLTHTELITNALSIKVLERILTKEIAQETPEKAVIGYNQYFHVGIETCNNEEYYLIIGQPLSEEATYDPLLCNCGNGICGVGEDTLNCPSDCATPIALPGICVIMPITLTGFAILVILLFILYLVKKYLVEYHKIKVGKKLEYITYAMLFLLAIATFWTRFACKKPVPYAYLILIIGILYILFVELWDTPQKTQKNKVEEELRTLRRALHDKKIHELGKKTEKQKQDYLKVIDTLLEQRKKEEKYLFLRRLFPRKIKHLKKHHPDLEKINKEIRENKRKS